MSADWYQDVLDFHRKFGAYVGEEPDIPREGTVELRWRLISEELNELHTAMMDEDLVEIADGIGDVIYVLLGTAVSYGIDLRPIFDAIHDSNMKKVGGCTRDDGKIMKPEGWVPPDIEGILAAQLRPKTKRDGFSQAYLEMLDGES